MVFELFQIEPIITFLLLYRTLKETFRSLKKFIFNINFFIYQRTIFLNYIKNLPISNKHVNSRGLDMTNVFWGINKVLRICSTCYISGYCFEHCINTYFIGKIVSPIFAEQNRVLIRRKLETKFPTVAHMGHRWVQVFLIIIV